MVSTAQSCGTSILNVSLPTSMNQLLAVISFFHCLSSFKRQLMCPFHHSFLPYRSGALPAELGHSSNGISPRFSSYQFSCLYSTFCTSYSLPPFPFMHACRSVLCHSVCLFAFLTRSLSYSFIIFPLSILHHCQLLNWGINSVFSSLY